MATTLDTANVRRHLKQFDLRRLFIEELGWDNHQSEVEVPLDDGTCVLHAIAEKRGMVAFEACVVPDGGVPDYATRRSIERSVAKVAHEHLIIYTDAAKTTQVWQWVKREPGRPASCKQHTFDKDQPGDALIQKLQLIAFSLEEEEDLTVVDVAGRVRKAFDVDRVTKRFYDSFKKEHSSFLKLIKGIAAEDEREWYASLMLNRLMFIYFIQRKGFLDGDPDYLRNRLRMMQERKKKDQFLTFYRHFLLRLFHEGLGQQEHTSELDELLGQVPYLDGGLFEVHKLEEANPDLHIPDAAFERLFDFFGQWHWHLDERPVRSDKEINPDVLGYIFEKYINQKQMGAYYTKEDITGYIARNTVIPFLFDAAREGCAVAFRPDGAVWRLLQDDPDRYIYDSVRQGVDLRLPESIAAGIDDVTQRGDWNQSADAEFALPTETWREHVARRKRCHEVRAKLAAGEVHDINDLITLNLDICQFAQDVIENCEGPELLRAFWKAIEKVTILDPTCGSGAFLFAALNILEPFYEACLVRMEAFVGDLDRSGEKHHPEKFSDFRKVLANVADHPNHRYFILKSIIISNLFGVDIMEEAVEICKLRLFLKLAAQVERFADLEPLPDIDFNIRAGNTLVGCASPQDVPRARLDFDDALPRIIENAEQADLAFQRFRQMQTDQEVDTADLRAAKVDLRDRLDALREELDRKLAYEYEGHQLDDDAFIRWRDGHQPFHWFVEFYGIIDDGGFDVVIGNPPYVQCRDVGEYSVHGYETLDCGDLYALTLERTATALLSPRGRVGMIVPVSWMSTDGYSSLRDVLHREWSSLWCSSFAERPSKLFEGVEKRLSILVGASSDGISGLWSTKYYRWLTEERDTLLQRLEYIDVMTLAIGDRYGNAIPKLGSTTEVSVLRRMSRDRFVSDQLSATRGHNIYYTRKLRYFVQFLDSVPIIREADGSLREPSELKILQFPTERISMVMLAALNSSLFFWFLTVLSDCRNLNRREVLSFPFDASALDEGTASAVTHNAKRLVEDFERHSEIQEVNYASGPLRIQTFQPRLSKPVIDSIDEELAVHYGLCPEEADFIVNHMIKYRMGLDE